MEISGQLHALDALLSSIGKERNVSESHDHVSSLSMPEKKMPCKIETNLDNFYLFVIRHVVHVFCV
jgi:hypothetical protein